MVPPYGFSEIISGFCDSFHGDPHLHRISSLANCLTPSQCHSQGATCVFPMDKRNSSNSAPYRREFRASGQQMGVFVFRRGCLKLHMEYFYGITEVRTATRDAGKSSVSRRSIQDGTPILVDDIVSTGRHR